MAIQTPPLTSLRTGDHNLDRVQDRIISALNPLLNAQFRWTNIGDAGAPGFANGWVTSNPVGSPTTVDSPPGFLKDTLGFVWLRGLMKSGTVAFSTPAFILPTGYRPRFTHRFAVVSNNAFGLLVVRATGNVEPSVGNNASFQLDGVRFLAEN